MKKFCCILAIVLCFSVTLTAQKETKVQKQDAIDLAAGLLSKDIGKVDVFISANPVPSVNGLTLHNRKISCPYSTNWVVFIDDYVFANWEHPCRYIFINAETKEYKIVKEVLPPDDLVNFDTVMVMKRPQPKLIRGSSLGKNTGVKTVASNPHCYAVIISGGYNDANNHIRYWNDISAIYCTLTQIYGFTPGNIFVHSADGTAAHNHGSLDLDGDGNADIDAPASYSSISSTFQTLAGTIGADDQLYIFVTDHGGSGSYIYLWGSDILTTSDLSSMLSPINASEIIAVLEQCYSGGFITNSTNITGLHRDIQTACSANESSWAECWITSAAYDEFSFYWTAAARGYYPDINSANTQPWTTYCSVGSFPFSNYFSSHPADYNPDTNGDGIVQMKEAFNYANNFDTWSSSGYYNPYYTSTSESPVESHNSGFQEDLLSLTGISGNIVNTQTVSGNFLVTGDLNLSNSILTVGAGSNFLFANGSSLNVGYYGILSANGILSSPITFDFVTPNSAKANGIKFPGNSSMGSISYCKIRNAFRGIYEGSCSINISNSAFSNCRDGIYLTNSSPTIQYCNFHDNFNAGIYLINYASPYLYNNYMRYNYYGVYSTTNSNPKFGYSSTQGKNGITDNYCGVYCWNNSYPVLGQSSPLNGGYNNLANNAAHNIDNESSGTVYANHIWWGSTTPANFRIYGSGTTSYTDYLSSGVTISPAPPLSKAGSELYAAGNSDIPMLSELDKAYELVSSNNLAEAREVCLNLINNYPDYSVSYNALNLLKETYSENELTSKKDIYKSLFNDKGKKDLHAMAGLILSDIDKGNRLKHIDEVIEKYKGESVVELALFNKFVYYYFDKEDEDKAREISKELDVQFPLSIGAIEAHKILGDEEYYKMTGKDYQTQKDTVTQAPGEYTLLLDNYPNPFNPTTTISYTLPETQFVTLKVYDILGREVMTLVNEYKTVGEYKVHFNGSNLPSGVYIYKLQTGNNNIVKKMMLIK